MLSQPSGHLHTCARVRVDSIINMTGSTVIADMTVHQVSHAGGWRSAGEGRVFA